MSIRTPFSKFRSAVKSTLAKPSTQVAVLCATYVGQANAAGGMFDGVTTFGCAILGSLTGKNSAILSMIFLVMLVVALLMWFLNENKEGLMVWGLRSAIAIGVLVNVFSLPPLLGMASVCSS